MTDLYDLEGFLSNLGIIRPRIESGGRPGMQGYEMRAMQAGQPSPVSTNEPTLERRRISPASLTGQSLSEFLSEINTPPIESDGRPGMQGYEMGAMEAVNRARELDNSTLDEPIYSLSQTSAQTTQPSSEPKIKPPAPKIKPPAPKIKPPAPNGASRPIPTLEGQMGITPEPIPTVEGIPGLEGQYESVEETVAAAPEEAKRKLSDVIAEYETRLVDAQDEAERRRLSANVFEAINSFGAIATGRDPDGSFFRRLAENSDQPIEDLKQQLELEKQRAEAGEKEALDDPNSGESVQARNLIEGVLPEFAASIPNFDQMSANALDEAMPFFNLRRQLDADAQNASLRWAKVQADLQKGKDDKTAAAKAKELEATDTQKTVENLSDIDRALRKQLELMKTSITGGTGPVANPGNIKGLFSSDYQALENIFNKINIKNMVATFTGMSKAVDSDAERAAWNRTQPSMNLDDDVNIQVLLGMQSSLLKDKVIKEAQREWLNQGRDLAEFKHPILEGVSTTVVNPRTGEMVIADKRSIPAGFVGLDMYTDMLINSDQTPLPRPTGFKSNRGGLSQRDEAAAKWLEENPDDPRAERIREKLNRKMGR